MLFLNRGGLLEALVKLFELPQDEEVPEDEHFIEIDDTPGKMPISICFLFLPCKKFIFKFDFTFIFSKYKVKIYIKYVHFYDYPLRHF